MRATGKRIYELALEHKGEKYVLGALAPKSNVHWKGPWDCAEFASWLVYQVAEKALRLKPQLRGSAAADAWTGFWARDARSAGHKISVAKAARTPGAALLRVPGANAIGHIVISDGSGGTIEAHSSRRGVIRHKVSGRRWDMGILVPGILYEENSEDVEIDPPETIVYRLRKPFMKGTKVREIQRELMDLGFHPGGLDGVYGPATQAAVVAFQISHGLVPDGEVGPLTARALGIELPPPE